MSFHLISGTVKATAPTSMTDEEGEVLFVDLEHDLRLGLDAVSANLREKYPNLTFEVEI
jgi:hypothetical protein